MSHPNQEQIVNLLGTLGSATPADHPTWCDRSHGDQFPVHTAFVGEIAYGPTLTMTVEIVDYGMGSGPHIHIELHDSREPGGDAYQLAAQAARDLSLLLAAGADILAGTTGERLELGVPR